MKVGIVIAVLLAIASCGHAQKAGNKADAQSAVENKRWVLQKLMGENVPKTGGDVYIRYINAIAFEGNGGCNRITGHYKLGDKTITMKDMAVTEMACDVMDWESKFLKMLEQADGYKIIGDNFYLYQGNKETASFRAIYLE